MATKYRCIVGVQYDSAADRDAFALVARNNMKNAAANNIVPDWEKMRITLDEYEVPDRSEYDVTNAGTDTQVI